tara:strand:+ start:433 stop:852 length:420 start_codon:yes stop_codon:yes gene_type:complete
MSETKWIQGKLVKQVYKDSANNFQLERKDGSTFGLIYKGSPLSKYERGTEVYATDASLYIDGKVKVYKTDDPPKFKFKEDTTTYIDSQGEVQPTPTVRELTTEELTLAGIELLLVRSLDIEVQQVRVLIQELAFKKLSV